MAHRVIGIDAATTGIKAAVLDSSLRGVEFKRVGLYPWPPAEAVTVAVAPGEAPPTEDDGVPPPPASTAESLLAENVDAVLRQMNEGGAEVFMGWDGHKCATRVLSFPIADLRKIEGMLDFELEDQLARGLEDIIYAYTPATISKEKTEIIVASTEKVPVVRFIEATNTLGRTPRALYHEAYGLLALAGGIGPVDAQTGLIVDIGHAKTQVLVMDHGRMLFCRTLREAGRRVDMSLARALGIDEAAAREKKEHMTLLAPHEQADTPEAEQSNRAVHAGLHGLVVGLRQTLLPYSYAIGGAPSVYITGGMSLMPGIDRHLSLELQCDVRPLPLPKALAEAPDGARYAMPYALALSGTQSVRHHRLDFRVGELAFRGDMSGLRSQARTWGIALALVIAIGFISGITKYSVLRSDEKKLDQSLKDVTKTMMGHEMNDFKQAITAIRQSVNPEKSVLPRFSALDYFGIVSQRIATDSDVKTSELEFRQDKILIKGEASTFDVVEKVVEGLKGHECFKGVNVGRQKKTTDGLRVEFNLTIDLTCGSS